MDDDLNEFLGKIEKFLPKDSFVERLKNVRRHEPKFNMDCLSWGQIKSKLWLIDELKKIKTDFKEVLVCAGWYGLLAHLLLNEEEIKIEKIRSVDIDENSTKIADSINYKWLVQDWKFKAFTHDIKKIDYENFEVLVTNSKNEESFICLNPDLIINTSCEHINNFDKWIEKIPKNMLCVLQSNNYFIHPEHVNCVNSSYELEKQSRLRKIHFSGQLKSYEYNRFMVIGEK